MSTPRFRYDPLIRMEVQTLTCLTQDYIALKVNAYFDIQGLCFENAFAYIKTGAA